MKGTRHRLRMSLRIPTVGFASLPFKFGGDPPEAYERLLLDSMNGDATLFTRGDEVLAAWKFTSRILDAWAAQPVANLPVYEAGTWGPAALDEFINLRGMAWRNLD